MEVFEEFGVRGVEVGRSWGGWEVHIWEGFERYWGWGFMRWVEAFGLFGLFFVLKADGFRSYHWLPLGLGCWYGF
jgi:hypothetical protein